MNPADKENETTALNSATVTKKTPVAVKKIPMRVQRTPRAIQKTPLLNHKPLPATRKRLTTDEKTDTVERGIPPVAGQQTPRAVHKAAPADQKSPSVAQTTPPIAQKTLLYSQNTAQNYRVNIPVDPKTPQFPLKKLPFPRVSKATSDAASCSLTPLFCRLQLRDGRPEPPRSRHMAAQTDEEDLKGPEQLTEDTSAKQSEQPDQENRKVVMKDIEAQTDDTSECGQLTDETTVNQAEQHSPQRGEQLTEANMETGPDEKQPMHLGQLTTETTDTQSEQCTQQPQDEPGAMDMEAQTDLEEQNQLWQYIAETVDKQCACGASDAERGYRGLYERVASRAIQLEGIDEEHAQLCQLVTESVNKQNAATERREQVESLAARVIQDMMTQIEEKNLQLEESTQMLDNARVMMKTLCDQLRANAERLRQQLHNTSEELREERTEWAAVRLRLEDERSVRRAEIDAARAESTRLRAELETALEQLATEKSRVHRFMEERSELRARVENMQFLEAENKCNAEELQAREEQIQVYAGRLDTVCHELKVALKAESAAREETVDVLRELAQGQHEATALRAELLAKDTELQGVLQVWEAARERTEQETACLQKSMELSLKLQKCNEELTQERRERSLAQVDVATLKEELRQLTATPEPQPDTAEDRLTEKIQLKQELNRMTHMNVEQRVELEEQNKRYTRHRYVLEQNERLANKEVTELQSALNKAVETLLVAPANVLECKAVADTIDLLRDVLMDGPIDSGDVPSTAALLTWGATA